MTIPRMKIKTPAPFPVSVSGTGGIAVAKTNGVWVIEPDFSQLASILASAVADPTTKQIWIWDSATDEYSVLTLSGLGDALYLLTSTTSLAISVASKVFVTQAGKDIGIGSWVLITSDADPTVDYMSGQVTAYENTTLTVNVTVIGGSGTHTDWTIRASGTPGATGATGATSGIKQAYSDTTTDTDPTPGKFQLNHATPASATAAYLDNVDAGGAAVSGIFDLWDDSTATIKGILQVEKSTDPAVWAQWQVTGSIVDGTGYRKVTLANGAGSGAFTATDVFAITFTRTGNDGGGVSSATANGVGYATGAAAMTSTAALTDGQIVVGQTGNPPLPKTISGAITLSAAGATALAVARVTSVVKQVFTATGTYTPTSGMIYALIECVGGGAGGGSAAGTVGQVFSGGGGGSGGYSRKPATAADIGASKAVTIGAGGAGGVAAAPTGNNGTAGGDTSVGTLCIAKGGSGGVWGATAQLGSGGAGGVAGTGDLTSAGTPGWSGFYNSANFTIQQVSGAGGSSVFGGGGRGTFAASGAATTGTAGGGYGAGGAGGATSNVAANSAGGAGSDGVVYITEFIATT